MSVTRIWKEHCIRNGPRKGQKEVFVVEPRDFDGAYCVKPAGELSNEDAAYTKVFTLDDVAAYTRQDWSVRMKGQDSGDRKTLKSKGLLYA